MKTPIDKTLVFTYYSHPVKRPEMRWKAKLEFAPGSTDGSPAFFTFVDGNGESVEAGIFEFAGQRLAVADGRAEIACGDFVRGIHEGGLWLHRKGMPPIPGALTFE